MITQKKLKRLLDYDPKTGVFIWKTNRKSTLLGTQAGGIRRKYLTIWIGTRERGRAYQAHRLAWLWVYGRFPKLDIDHIDGDGLNNAISNLREALTGENLHNRGKQVNNHSGFKGVSWHAAGRKWQASIQVGGKSMGLGLFGDAKEAAKNYDIAAIKYRGKFAKTNQMLGLL